MDVGLRGDLLDLLAALAPCAHGYAEIGRALAPALIENEAHPYAGWIAAYASETFQQGCAQRADLLALTASRRIGDDPIGSPRWPGLVEIFTRATELERDFWSMGLRGA